MMGAAAAGDPGTSPAKLARLARSRNAAIRYIVAQNPSTPAICLEILAIDRGPGLMDAVAANPSTPESSLEQLVRSREASVRAAVFANPSTPAAILSAILSDSRATLDERVGAAGNTATPASTLEQLARGNASERIRVAVAGNQSASSNTLSNLLGAADLETPQARPIALALASNPATPSSTRARLYDVPAYRQIILATRTLESTAARIAQARSDYNSGGSILKLFAHDQDPEIRRAVAVSPRVSREILDALASDDEPAVAIVAKARTSSDEHELRRLAEQSDALVLEALVRNPHSPPDLRPFLARAIVSTAGDDLLRVLGKDDGTPPDVLQRIAAHSNWGVRQSVAGNDSAPPDALKLLSIDTQPSIRALVGRMSGLSTDILVRLASDTEPTVRAAVAGGESTPSELLLRLASDGVPAVVEAVAANDCAPPDVLERIVDEQTRLRRNYQPQPYYRSDREKFPLGPLVIASANPNTPAGSIRTVATNSVVAVKSASFERSVQTAGEAQLWEAIAGNPSSPADALQVIAHAALSELQAGTSPDHEGRALEKTRQSTLSKVTKNPSTDIETLELLSSGSWVARRTTTRDERDDGHTFSRTVWDGPATAAARTDMARAVRMEITRRLWTARTTQLDRYSFSTNPDASPEILDELSGDPEIEVRQAVAANRSVRPKTLLRLAADAKSSIRLAAAGSTHPDPESNENSYAREPLEASYGEAFELLARDSEPQIRAAVAANAKAFWVALSAATRSQMAYDTSAEVRSAILASISVKERAYDSSLEISESALLHLIETGAESTWRTIAACHGKLPSEVMERLVDTGDPESAALIAKDYRASTELLVRLAEAEDAGVLEAVASRQYFGRDEAMRAAVTHALILNPRTPESFMKQVTYRTNDPATVMLAAKHPNFPEEQLIRFGEGTDEARIMAAAESGNSRAIAAVASNESASAEALSLVATNADPVTRSALLLNKSIPPALLVQLIDDASVE